ASSSASATTRSKFTARLTLTHACVGVGVTANRVICFRTSLIGCSFLRRLLSSRLLLRRTLSCAFCGPLFLIGTRGGPARALARRLVFGCGRLCLFIVVADSLEADARQSLLAKVVDESRNVRFRWSIPFANGFGVRFAVVNSFERLTTKST